MRKLVMFLIYILAAVIIGCVAFFFLGGAKVSPEQVLPAEPLLYLNVKGLERNLSRLQGTVFGQKLEKIDPSVFIPKNAAVKAAVAVDDRIDNKEVWDFLRKNLLGEEFSLAIYDPDIDPARLVPSSSKEMGELTDSVLKSVYLVARIKPYQKFMESFRGLFGTLSEDVVFTSEKYRKYEMHNVRFNSANLSFSYVKISDIVIIGASPEALIKCVDIYEGESEVETLADDPDYVDAVERVREDAESFGFIDLEKMYAFALKGGNFADKMQNWRGMKTMAFAGSWDDHAEMSMSLFLDMQKIDPDMKSFYDCPASANQTLDFVPEDVAFYQWGNCLKADMVFSQMIAADKYTVEDKMNDYRDRTGVDLRKDVISNIGEQFGWYIEDVETKYAFPIPKAVVMLGVKNDRAIAESVQKMLAATPFRTTESVHAGIMIHSIASPIGDVLSPSYCFMDGLWLVASNKSVLEKALNVRNKKEASITRKAVLSDFVDIMNGSSRGLQIIDFDRMGQKMVGVAKWLNSFISAREQSYGAFISGAEARQRDLVSQLEKRRFEMAEMQTQRKGLDTSIKGATQLSPDIIVMRDQLVALDAKLEAMQKDIVGLEEQKAAVDKVVGQYRSSADSADMRASWERSFFVPLAEAMREIVSYVSWSTWDKEDAVLDTNVDIKIKENVE